MTERVTLREADELLVDSFNEWRSLIEQTIELPRQDLVERRTVQMRAVLLRIELWSLAGVACRFAETP